MKLRKDTTVLILTAYRIVILQTFKEFSETHWSRISENIYGKISETSRWQSGLCLVTDSDIHSHYDFVHGSSKWYFLIEKVHNDSCIEKYYEN